MRVEGPEVARRSCRGSWREEELNGVARLSESCPFSDVLLCSRGDNLSEVAFWLLHAGAFPELGCFTNDSL